jgi:hypothetical protein
LAVNAGAVAIPLALVDTLAVVDPPNVPLAPVDGAVNVTVAPLTGLPLRVTVACKAVVKAVLTVALCDVPAVAAIMGTAVAVFVRLKPARVPAPLVLAVTL